MTPISDAQVEQKRTQTVAGYVAGEQWRLRPSLFLALGHREPPEAIVLAGCPFRRVAILKYDSWAATAIYANEQHDRVACKFNRTQPLGFIPMRWLGRALARREQRVFGLVQDEAGFPRWAGPVIVDRQELPNAVSHVWIDGRPFNPWVHVNDQFFPRLRDMVAALHRHDIAYVDMSKWENILVGDDGQPYLIDYQIHYQLPRGWPFRWWLRGLQAADRFYLCRHWSRVRPDQLNAADWGLLKHGPWVVRIGEALGHPWRFIRRTILRLAGVREDDRKLGISDVPKRPSGNGGPFG